MTAVLALQRGAGNRAVASLLGAGGGGGGGSVKASTFTADVGAISQSMGAAHQEAGAAASAYLGSAPTPMGLPVGAAPSLAEPAAPAVAAADGATPPVPNATDNSVESAATVTGLAARERAEGESIEDAGRHAVGEVDALRVGRLGAPAAIGSIARPALPAAGVAPLAVDGVPTIEPAVAEVLDAGFGGQLSAAAGAVQEEQAAAVATHARMVGEARTVHDDAVNAEQDAADSEARELDDGVAAEVAGHQRDWRAESRGITAGGRSELRTLRATASTDVLQQAGAANTEATSIVSDARREADRAADSAPPVQRSLWGRIKSTASSAVGAVRSGISAVSSAARSVLTGALNQVRGLFDRARQAIADRVGRFLTAARDVATRVGARLGAAARSVVGAIRRVVSAGRAALGRLVTRLRAFAVSALRGAWQALRAAGGWLRGRLTALGRRLVAAGRRVLALAGKVRELLRVTGSEVLTGLARAVRDPAAFLAPYRATVAGMIAAAPDAARQMYDQHVAPLLGGGQDQAAATSSPGAQRTLQRQETDTARQPEAEAPSRGAILWEFLSDRLSFLGNNWGSVILNVLLEIFVPFVSLYRHLPPMLGAVWRGLKDLFAGRFSDAVDEGLTAARELMAILATLFAQASIAAFIAGSVLGTPIVGEGAMLAVGLTLLAADVVLQVASIAKAWSNLDRPGRTEDQLSGDYGTMADSVLSLGVTLALVLIAAVGQKLAKVLVARYPKVASALAAVRERIKVRAREVVGLENPPATARPVVDVPNAPAVASEALEFPGRAGLTASEQPAFDRFIAGQRAAGRLTPEFEARLKTMTPDQLRRVAREPIANQAQVEADQARQARAETTNQSNPLDPVMAQHQDVGGNVRVRFNEVPPSQTEIAQAQGIARATGEPVELFGDAFGGIDGTIGRPPRPLQLKGPPQAGQAGATAVYESAVTAQEKAVRFGFRDVETHITAPNVTRAEVAAEFARQGNPGAYIGGGAVRRVRVYCQGGEVYVPPSTAVVPPPAHVDTGQPEDRVPATVGAPAE